ncbi:tRNA (uracil-5-)-methyltransferase -like protein A, partial [Trichinella spiralis]
LIVFFWNMSSDDVQRNQLEDSTKIHIHNLPRYMAINDMKKILKRHGFRAKKIALMKEHAYVTFSDPEQANQAAEKLDQMTFKQCVLRVRKTAADDESQSTKKKPTKSEERTELVNIVDVVTPWHAVPYEEQLKNKQNACYEWAKKCSIKIYKECGLPFQGKLHYGELENIRASPVQNYYRNKCEFTIGYNGTAPEVGFRLSRHRDGCTVQPVDGCVHIPTTMKLLVRDFKNSILSCSPRPPYNAETRTGFWRLLTIKSFQMDLMLTVTVNPVDVDEAEINSIKGEIVKRFLYQDMDNYRVSSVYFQRLINAGDKVEYELLGGCPHVYETIDNMHFRISPYSFFQVNTAGCEVLYKTLFELCASVQVDHSLLLDICCGTGTIGIYLARLFEKVIGIESVEPAVKDACHNMIVNEQFNCDFQAGKVEELLPKLLKESNVEKWKTCVAVLDPPRGGVSGRVIAALRCHEPIHHLFYVSCDVQAAEKNFVDLCKRASKRYPGPPFRLLRMIPVDMFPHTKLFELVLHFQRSRPDQM